MRNVPYTLSKQEQRDFLETFNVRHKTPHRDFVMCRLMLECGLRSGEVRNLTVPDVDLAQRRIDVIEGKGGKDRVVWMNEGLVSEVAKWLQRRDGQGTDLLFPTGYGNPVSRQNLWERVRRAAKQANVRKPEEVSPHTLRHTFATNLLRNGANLRQVQEALGHADIQSTEIYTHIANEELEEVMVGVQPA